MWLGALVDRAEGLALKAHHALHLPCFLIVIMLGFWETVYCVLHRFIPSESNSAEKTNTYIRQHRDQNPGEKVAIVTGANGGIGLETARALGRAGFTTILACRNLKRGQRALTELEESTGLKCFVLMEVDLASFMSIEQFAKEFEASYSELHLLVCNAGVAFSHYDTTYDGLESQFGTNFVGHYVLINRLVRMMKPGGRITVASSVAACMVREIDYTRVTDVWRFDRFANYSTSKLALLAYSNALARRLEPQGITVNAFHPGLVATSLYRNVLFSMLPGIHEFRSWLWLDQKVGSVTSIYLALSPEMEGRSGGYYAREQPAAMHPCATKTEVQERLCQFTEVLVKTNTHAQQLLESINSPRAE